MNVFVSWSGVRSQRVADLLKFWLKCTVQACEPWLSTKDIDRGSVWFSEINTQLKESSIGILCVTRENKEKPWILFEAGALAKGLETSRVIPLLIDLESSEIFGPLAQFNHTSVDEAGIRSLILTINAHAGKMGIDTLNSVFNAQWPVFKREFDKIISETDNPGPPESIATEDYMSGLMELMQSMNSRMRSMEERLNRTSYSWNGDDNVKEIPENFSAVNHIINRSVWKSEEEKMDSELRSDFHRKRLAEMESMARARARAKASAEAAARRNAAKKDEE